MKADIRHDISWGDYVLVSLRTREVEATSKSMPDDFFAMINDLPGNDSLEDWHRWRDQLLASGNDLLEMVDTLLASSTDQAIAHRLEIDRARIISMLAFAERCLSKEDDGRTTAPTGRKVVH